MSAVEFKPSDVELHAIPLPGTFGRAEREQAASILVRVCQVLGDRWQAVTWTQVKAVLRADVARATSTITASWLESPMFRPDVHSLCDNGFADRDPSTGAIALNATGLKALRRWVMPRYGERGEARARPQFLLVPVELNYRPDEALGTLDGFALHRSLWDITDPAWSLGHTPLKLNPSGEPVAVELQRSTWTQEVRWSPAERRRIARWHRRRKAVPVPMATRHTVEIFAPVGMPSPVGERLIGPLLGGTSPTLAVWRCRGWRCGAFLWRSGATK